MFALLYQLPACAVRNEDSRGPRLLVIHFKAKRAQFSRKSDKFGLQTGSLQWRTFPDRWTRRTETLSAGVSLRVYQSPKPSGLFFLGNAQHRRTLRGWYDLHVMFFPFILVIDKMSGMQVRPAGIRAIRKSHAPIVKWLRFFEKPIPLRPKVSQIPGKRVRWSTRIHNMQMQNITI